MGADMLGDRIDPWLFSKRDRDAAGALQTGAVEL